jgi:hypothetical protein
VWETRGKRKDRMIHREHDKADRSRHDNKHRTRGGGERVEYKAGEPEAGPHICQQVLESVLFDIMDKGVLYMEG